jgi:hypothetical protein
VADDPTIKIKVTTDTTGATQGLDKAAQQTESFGSRFKSTFTGVLAANVIQNVASKVFDFGKTSVEAYEKAESNAIKYHDALKRIPGASDLVTLSLEAQAKALSNVTIYSAGQTKQAQATLAQFGLTGDQLRELTPLVQDYATKTGQDLPTAASAIGKALLGQGRALKGVGINFKDTKTLAGNYGEIVDSLKGKVGGLAEQMGGTSAGKMQIMQNKVTALKVQLGAALVPAIEKVAEVLTPLMTFIGEHASVLIPLAMGVTAVAVAFKLLNAVMLLFGANPSALLIMGIAIAVVLLVVAIYELWTHWDTVWGWIKDKVDTVWQWIQTTWDTITDILQAPFLAFWNWIQSTWDSVLAIIQGVWDWITNTWNTLYASITAPFLDAWNWIKAHVIDPLTSGWNTIANAVNSIHFKVEIPSWVPVVGGKGFEWAPPHVPTLAQGGLMTADGLVFAHAGEVISPAPASASGRNGPAIVIETATFSEEVDVTTFLRRASWEIQTQRI